MPLVAPVITATLPSSRPITFPLSILVEANIPGCREQGKRALPHRAAAGRSGWPASIHGEIPGFRQVRPYFGFADHVK
jgi:hypothetical protein